MSRLRERRNGAFTLIELMIVIAIIGILAAVAIPNFVRFQLRSKSSEAKTNLAGIRTAQESYFAETGTYVQAPISPAALNAPPSTKQSFVDAGAAGANFATVGWIPEGYVFFIYGVNVVGTDYTADATADIDNDGTNQLWGYAHTVAGAAPVVVGLNGCTGAWDSGAATATVPNQVGPCDGTSGQSTF